MKAENQTRRSELLKEFFLNASLIAAFHELAKETARLDALVRKHGLDPEEFGLLEEVPVPAA